MFWLFPYIRRRKNMDDLLRAVEESLLNHNRPIQVAFHFYELLSKAGYDDEYIQEVASALEDIVS
jgi:uncharacterized protein YpiB (UPF0302 family)